MPGEASTQTETVYGLWTMDYGLWTMDTWTHGHMDAMDAMDAVDKEEDRHGGLSHDRIGRGRRKTLTHY